MTAPRAHTLLPCLVLGLAAAGAAGSVPAAAAAGAPAEWRSYDVLVEFTALPRTYSCDQLWYKLRDILRAAGARAYMTITPYDCGVRGGGPALAPRVHLQFQLPLPLHGAATRYAQIDVVDATLRLAPGSPRSLTAADCEFVRQLQGTLLAALPLRITAADFSCHSPQPSYALTAATVLPVRAAATRADAGGAPRA